MGGGAYEEVMEREEREKEGRGRMEGE